MPPRRRDKPKADAGERILLAAAHEFAERGFAGARVDAIARRAGANKAMLYYHVGDKVALYERVLLDAVTAVEASLEDALPRESTAEGRIRALGRVFESVAAQRPYLPRIMLREMSTGGKDLPTPAIEALARIVRMEESVLKSAARSGDFHPVNVMTFHILLIGGTMLHLVSRGVRERIRGAALSDLPEPQGSPAEAVVDLLLEGLRSEGKRRPARTPRSKPKEKNP